MTKKMQHFSLKVLTINIHKGFTAFNRRFILPELRDAVRTVSADIVCLQASNAKKAGKSHLMIAQNPVYLFTTQGGVRE